MPIVVLSLTALVGGLCTLFITAGAAGLAGVAVMFLTLFVSVPLGARAKRQQALMLENRNQILNGLSGDVEEAAAAFFEKRKPRFD